MGAASSGAGAGAAGAAGAAAAPSGTPGAAGAAGAAGGAPGAAGAAAAGTAARDKSSSDVDVFWRDVVWAFGWIWYLSRTVLVWAMRVVGIITGLLYRTRLSPPMSVGGDPRASSPALQRRRRRHTSHGGELEERMSRDIDIAARVKGSDDEANESYDSDDDRTWEERADELRVDEAAASNVVGAVTRLVGAATGAIDCIVGSWDDDQPYLARIDVPLFTLHEFLTTTTTTTTTMHVSVRRAARDAARDLAAASWLDWRANEQTEECGLAETLFGPGWASYDDVVADDDDDDRINARGMLDIFQLLALASAAGPARHLRNDEEDAAIERAREARRDTAIRVLRRMVTQSGLSRGFNAWRAWMETTAKQRGVVKKVLKRMTQSALCRSFGSWRDATAETARQTTVMRKVLLRIAMSALSGGFFAWKDATETAQKHRRIGTKVLKRLTQFALSRGFEDWRLFAETNVKQRRLIYRRAAHLARRLLLQMFEAWREWTGLNSVGARLLLAEDKLAETLDVLVSSRDRMSRGAVSASLQQRLSDGLRNQCENLEEVQVLLAGARTECEEAIAAGRSEEARGRKLKAQLTDALQQISILIMELAEERADSVRLVANETQTRLRQEKAALDAETAAAKDRAASVVLKVEAGSLKDVVSTLTWSHNYYSQQVALLLRSRQGSDDPGARDRGATQVADSHLDKHNRISVKQAAAQKAAEDAKEMAASHEHAQYEQEQREKRQWGILRFINREVCSNYFGSYFLSDDAERWRGISNLKEKRAQKEQLADALKETSEVTAELAAERSNIARERLELTRLAKEAESSAAEDRAARVGFEAELAMAQESVAKLMQYAPDDSAERERAATMIAAARRGQHDRAYVKSLRIRKEAAARTLAEKAEEDAHKLGKRAKAAARELAELDTRADGTDTAEKALELAEKAEAAARELAELRQQEQVATVVAEAQRGKLDRIQIENMKAEQAELQQDTVLSDGLQADYLPVGWPVHYPPPSPPAAPPNEADAPPQEDSSAAAAAQDDASIHALEQGYSLTLYQPNGKRKHDRVFWLSNSANGVLAWGKKKSTQPNKTGRLLGMQPEIAAVPAGSRLEGQRSLGLTVVVGNAQLLVVAKDAATKRVWVDGLTAVLRRLGKLP